MNITAVVVNYNSDFDLVGCVDSLLVYLDISDGDEIIVVDNNSTDSSISCIEELTEIKIIKLQDNIGYGGACNIGANYSRNEILLFLNPDVELKSTVATVKKIFSENSMCAIVSPQIYDSGSSPYLRRSYPTVIEDALGELGLWLIIPKRNNDNLQRGLYSNSYTSGSMLFVRREAFMTIGGFDEDFFLYYEEVDLFKRIEECGYLLFYEPKCQAVHSSAGCSESIKEWEITAIRYNSKYKYFSKHTDGIVLITHICLTVLILACKISILPFIMAIRSTSYKRLKAYTYALKLYIMGYKPWR